MKKLLLIFTLLLWIPDAYAITDFEPNWFWGKVIDFVFLIIVALAATFLAYVLKARHEINKFKYSNEFEKGKKAYDKEDYPEAIQIFRPLAEKGYADAQLHLGLIYTGGFGVLKSHKKASEWFRKSAEQGNPNAQNNLGYLYRHGIGVEQNYDKAAKWFYKAAKQGNTDGQNNLAAMHAEGKGVEKNLAKAVEWHLKAADMGNVSAQNNLGWMYENEIGVDKDYEEALKWYRQVAKTGHSVAQYNLGRMYLTVLDKKDIVLAYMWFSIASTNGSSEAKKVIELIQKEIPARAIETAKMMARQCIESNYKDCPDDPEEDDFLIELL